MAKFMKVPEEHWKIMWEYLDEPGVVLIPEHVFEQLPPDKKKKLEELLDDPDRFEDLYGSAAADYNFGGDPTLYVDLALSPDCYALEAVLGRDKKKGFTDE